jgi:hypothetical protein
VAARRASARRFLLFAGGAFALIIVLRSLPAFAVDVLWFREVGYLPLFVTTLWARGGMQLLFGGVFLAFFLANVLFALRRLPPNIAALHEMRALLPAMDQIRPALRAIAAAVGLLVALIVSSWGQDQWLTWLQFRHPQAFGILDPVFHHDLGFYVFTLPFLNAALGFVRFAIVFTGVVTAAVYFVQGQFWFRPGFLAITAPARRHVMLLIAGGMLAAAAGDVLGRYQLLYSSRGIVAGAGFADLHATLPALVISAVVSAAAGIAVAIESFRRSFLKVTGIAVVAMIAAHVLLVQLWPFALQRLVVQPNELERERPYLVREIEATRRAFGLDSVTEGRFPASANISADRVTANAATINNVRLWESEPLERTNSQLQEIRTYYDFVGVDNDRYVIGGELQQVALSTRELNPAALPARIWINEHLTYTHGYGVCVAPVNHISPEGLPDYIVKDIPPSASVPELKITRPEIYYGELGAQYTFVSTRAKEFDYPSGEDNVYTSYRGRGGIRIGGFGSRLLFALRFAEPKILLSTDLVPDSRVLIHRTIRERIGRIAPFLEWDRDPYLVIREDGTLTWMLDGYASTDRIPYSAPAGRTGNYIRNPVKATVDAYDGTVRLWAVQPDEPLLRAYAGIFPGTFAPIDSMPKDLREHIRYPEGLFSIQAQVYATYHMTDPQVFYNKEDLWRVARREDGTSMAPYFTVMKLAGVGKDEEFILMLPFTPARKENMIAWMSARCDPPNYGKLLVYSFPKQRLVYGPEQIESRINQDTDISKELTLWNQQGSQVIRGNLLVVPVDSSLIYFQPLYLQSQSQAGLPELKRILVACGDRIAMESSMSAALARVFGEGSSEAETPEQTVAEESSAAATGRAPPPGDARAAQRLEEARAIYERAQQALRRGDLQGYAREIEALGKVLGRAESRSP